MKKAISIRLDTEVLEYFKTAFPSGYQTALSNVLRHYVQTQTHQKSILLGRAQELFRQYHSQCFWHLKPDLKITAESVHIVWEGLRVYGGRPGYLLAYELEQLWKGPNAP
jgi:hypothetical protein